MTQEGREFLDHLKMHVVQDALSPMREKAWERLLAMGMPQRSDEAFRSVVLRDLYAARFMAPQDSAVVKRDIEEFILPEAQHSHLVFVDGLYCAHLSDTSALPVEMLIIPLTQALRTHGHFLQAHLQRTLKEEKDPFALLNVALHRSGLFVYVPPRLHIDVPVHCLHVATGTDAQFIASRNHVMLGAQSEMKWLNTQHFLKDVTAQCANLVSDLLLDEGAKFELCEHLSPSGAIGVLMRSALTSSATRI